MNESLAIHGYDVFFSQPLDIDFLMLSHFPEAYMKLEEDERGPNLPDQKKNEAGYQARIAKAIRVTLGDDGGEGATYSDKEKGLFPWYTYRFLGKGKPMSHLLALGRLEPGRLAGDMPAVFDDLVSRIREKLNLVAETAEE
jgi:putative ATP-dependent endonuclease of OLD family